MLVTTPTLILVRETKIRDLMPGDESPKHWEASGILVKDGEFFVVFDDCSQVGRFAVDLQPSQSNGLVGPAHADLGYEGIAYNANKQRFYLLVEARKRARDCYQASVVEYDDDFHYLKERPLDFTFKSGNKGFEAVAYIHRDGQDYVLALCEGNKCKCGSKGRTPGGGRIQVFEKKKKRWAHAGTIALPTTLPFVDYSGMSIGYGQIAIVSQVNSMLWVGQFDATHWTCSEDSQLYEFPRSDQGSIRYGNIEGVSWINPTRIATVSDRRKKDQSDKTLSDKDQSMQIFDIPTEQPSILEANSP